MIVLNTYKINTYVYVPFIVDSGATGHFINKIRFITNIIDLKIPKIVTEISLSLIHI